MEKARMRSRRKREKEGVVKGLGRRAERKKI